MTFDEVGVMEQHSHRRAKWAARLRFVGLSIAASIPLAVVLAIFASIIVTKQVCGL